MTEPEKVRSAGVRQADRLAVGLDTAGIVQAAKRSEIDSTSRVYVKVWQLDGRFDTEQAADLYAAKYAGRLKEGDLRIELDNEGHEPSFVVYVRTWTVDSEWKRFSLADEFAKARRADLDLPEDDVEVVGRNSRREHMLNAYGTLKLA